MAKSPEGNAASSDVLRYDLGWKAINDMLRSGRSLSGHERNCVFLNLGGTGQERFADISAATAGDFADDGRVLALADWDYDGDPDLWIGNRSSPSVRFLRNDLGASGNFVALRLHGSSVNRDAIGARVTVTVGGSSQTKTLHAGQGYLAQSSKWLHFGLGSGAVEAAVSVTWPGGGTEGFASVAADRWFDLTEGTGVARPWQQPLFAPLAPGPLEPLPVGDAARLVLLEPLPLPDLEGLTSGVGHARLVTLWAHWCAPCLTELSEWAGHATEFEQARLEIVALNVDESEDLAKWDALALPFTYRFGDRELVEQFDVLQRSLVSRQRPLPLPSSFLIDSEGRLRAVYRGPVNSAQLLADASLIDRDRDATLAAATPLPGRWHQPPGGSSPVRLAIQFIEGGYREHAEAYLAALAETPRYRSAPLLNLLGALLVDREEFAGAASAFRRALEIDPDDRKAHVELGDLLLRANRGAAAAEHFSTVLTNNPNDPELVLKHGLALMVQEKLPEARLSVKRAISLGPTPSAHWRLGQIEHALGDAPAAVSAFEACLAMDPLFLSPQQNDNLSTIAAAYADAGRFQDAAKILAVATAPDLKMEEKLAAYRAGKK